MLEGLVNEARASVSKGVAPSLLYSHRRYIHHSALRQILMEHNKEWLGKLVTSQILESSETRNSRRQISARILRGGNKQHRPPTVMLESEAHTIPSLPHHFYSPQEIVGSCSWNQR